MAIVFEDLSYKYPGTTPMPGSELVGVIGRNGAGKSTLCLALNGLVPHFFRGDFRGRLTIDGRSTQDLAVTDLITQVGVLFQNPFEQITGVTESVYEEVAFGPESLGLARDKMVRRVEAALRNAAGCIVLRSWPTINGGLP